MAGIQNVWKEAEKDGNTRWGFLKITCSQTMKDPVPCNKENEFHSVDNGATTRAFGNRKECQNEISI